LFSLSGWFCTIESVFLPGYIPVVVRSLIGLAQSNG